MVVELLAVLLLSASEAGTPDFSSEVRPILARHCLKCHGPDEARREGGVRFDVFDGAVAEGDSGRFPVVPHRPEESELIRRITSEDEAEQMPPPSAKMPLSEDQIDILRRWIASGAEYEEHWAFQPPRAASPPAVRDASQVRNPIDRFLQARLETEGLAPSPEADRAALIRRASLDLIGLPPTEAELQAFLDDPRPDAYEALVDRLLASPRYGERWARRWLDLARYADTNGYEKDRPRSMWPWRDWVIRALNADQPFDEFTIDQIAGDLRPNASLEQLVATGFHRNTMINEEGGIDPLEFRFHAMTDRVGTTGAVWLGLTLMCAQCHTHKFDPLLHTEYYEVFACLNNADELKLPVPDPAIAAERERLQAELAALEAALPSRFPAVPEAEAPDLSEPQRRERAFQAALQAWIERERSQAVEWTIRQPAQLESNLPKLDLLADGSVLARGDQTKRDVYSLRLTEGLAGATALRLEALPHDSLPRRGPGRTHYEGPEGEFFLSEVIAHAVLPDGERRRVQLDDGGTSDQTPTAENPGSDARFAVDGDPQTGWSTNGRFGEPRHAVFRLREPLQGATALEVELIFERYYAAALGRFRISLTAAEQAIAARPYEADVEELLLRPESSWSEADRERVVRAFALLAPELAEARAELAELRKRVPEFPTTLVLRERPADDPRPTHVYRRGEFLTPTEEVTPGTPEVLHPVAGESPLDRLRFAEWLVDRQNPLAARVTANRHWQMLFGTGLVRTTDDFGYQGELPSHPELLDWLAVDFMRDWSVKRLHRLIVTSGAYRRSSTATEAQRLRDPENRLLARGPRVRIDAEALRDSALAAAGLLSDRMYGPSVYPPQPASITTEGAYGQLAWTVSEGEDRHRRGLYTFMKRTAPYAMFATFDGPSGEACLARRDISNTPLQALTLLNDVALLEAAQALGREMAGMPSDGDSPDRERAAGLIRRCLSRGAEPDELDRLAAFAARTRSRFQSAPEQAAQAAGIEGESAVEAATWTAVARAVMNLDEFVTK
ncbi:MAG: PSD1 domain-containing protein [Planctomyces sp.]|nr:PSD1 domain-containing protein [Planctomyces sp.]